MSVQERCEVCWKYLSQAPKLVRIRSRYFCSDECAEKYKAMKKPPSGRMSNKQTRSCGMGCWSKLGD